MKITFTFILIVIGVLSACSSIQRTTDDNEYDFLKLMMKIGLTKNLIFH